MQVSRVWQKKTQKISLVLRDETRNKYWDEGEKKRGIHRMPKTFKYIRRR